MEGGIKDFGYDIPEVRNRWARCVNTDGSGKDVFIHPSHIRFIEVINIEQPEVWMNLGTYTASTSSPDDEVVDLVVKVIGKDALDIMEWMTRNTGIQFNGEPLNRRPSKSEAPPA